MQKIIEYEQLAADCRQRAAQMKNLRYKKQLEEMAEGWDRLANERRQGIIKNETNNAADLRETC